MSNNRQIANNMFFNVVTFGINLCINFFLTPYLIRSVGKEAYSFFPLVGNMVGYVNIITTAVGSMGGRFMTMAYYQGRKDDAQEYWNSMFFANIILSMLYSVIFIFACLYINHLLNVPNNLLTDVRWLFGLCAVSLLVGLISSNFATGCYLKNRLDLSASRQMIATVINAVAIVALFFFFRPSILYVGLATLICALFNGCFNWQLKKKLLPDIPVNPLRMHSWKKMLEVSKSSVWNAVNHLSTILTSQLDLLIANIFISAAATGDYALVKVIPNFIISLLAVSISAFTPNFNILYAKGNREELINEVRKSMKIIGLIMSVPLGFFLIYAYYFFHLWVPSQNSNYLHTLSFFTVLPIIITASINPVNNLFSVTNHLRIPAIVLFVTGILMFVVDYFLLSITNWGLWVIVGVSVVQMTLRYILFVVPYGAYCIGANTTKLYGQVIKEICATFVVCFIAYFVKSFFEIDTWFVFLVNVLIVSLLSYSLNSFIFLNKEERNYIVSVIRSKIHR